MAKEFYNSRKYKRKGHSRYTPRGTGRKGLATKLVVGGVFLVLIGVTLLWVLPTYTDYGIKLFVKDKPAPTVAPTPTPTEHPITTADVTQLECDINITDSAFQWFTDGYSFGDKLIFTAGEISADGDTYMDAIMQVDVDKDKSKLASRINIVLENDCVMTPVFNDSWLVYFDAKAEGGGSIKCCKQGSDFSKSTEVKRVYAGYPALFLAGNYLAWTERTGTSMDKLFICDLTTMESATVQTFSQLTCYGVSKPHLLGKQLVWADVESENSTGEVRSQICILDVESGQYTQYKPGTYAHDPKSDGKDTVAWITGNHGPDSNLCVSIKGAEPKTIAEGVVDFYMDRDFIAYQKDLAVFVYIPSTDSTVRITKTVVSAQIVGASNGCVIWNEVGTGERESIRFMKVPK